MNDQEVQRGAAKIAALGQKVALAMHKQVSEVVEASDLSDHQKIGAALVAMSAVYCGGLEAVLASNNEAIRKLAVGCFETTVVPLIHALYGQG